MKAVAKDLPETLTENLHELLTGDEEARLCRDIPDAACRHQPENFTIQLLSLASTKTGDGLADPKLVLAWLLGSLGAPAAAIGLLVPVRESLALLPQLFSSAKIRSLPKRKWAWAIGSIVQGGAVMAMAATAVLLDGAAAGWTIIGLLAVFAMARSVCSVSYKDVLGKTVSKQSRGTATGAASSVAAALVLLFGALLSTDILPLNQSVIAATLLLAGALWIFAGVLFTTIVEETGATEGGENAWRRAIGQLSLLKHDPQLVRFIVVRGLLIATALAPPFILASAGQSSDRSIGSLGPFVIATSLASVLSSYVWGRFSDHSSRSVLIAASLVGAVVLAAIGTLTLVSPSNSQRIVLMAAALFVLMIAYQGVRLGRSTHLIDMADQDQRAAYTALSNTIIGLLLLAGGIFGIIADWLGTPAVLLIFAVMCITAAALAFGLKEVQAQ
ncbi:MAG: MFS transporter [Alphaproteobacteria bacterium]|nr:MFS transporter [Alphaproteobacteria bacterium]